jgi:hypothetical protein
MNASPSFLLLGKGKNPYTVRWSMKDRLLSTAVIQLEDEKCPSCGTPYWLGHTSHGSVDYRVDFDQCLACAELELVTKDMTLDPGVRPSVRAVGAVDESGVEEPLPSRQEALEVPNDVEIELPRR